MALVAPRPLLDTEGVQDTWANYHNGYRGLQAADAVYKFLGATGAIGEGLLTDGAALTPESAGTLLQYRLDTEHVLNEAYWNKILDFADLHLPAADSP